jgi:amino acid adenylation domain-containing protein
MIPLSHAQQRLWLLDRIHGPNPTYNVPHAYTLTGPLDQPALHQALTHLTTRHEILRTVLPIQDDQPYQRIIDVEHASVPLTVAASTETDIHADLRAATLQPFDLESDLPIRAWLFRITAEHHVLLLVLHHIATDGWSTTPLLNDLSHAYTAHHHNHTPDQPPLPVQYADYTLWQHQLLGDTTDPHSLLTTQLTHWTTTLTNLPEEIPLPTDHPRPAEPSFSGAVVAAEIPPTTARALSQLAGAEQVSLFMVVQAALVTLLHHLGAGTDIPIGTVIAARNDEALDNLIGFFTNTLVLRTNLTQLPPNPTYTQLLHHTRTTNLTAYTNQDLPFDTLVEHLNPTRTLTRHPLFQTMLIVEATAAEPAGGLDLPDVRAEILPIPTTNSKFDLTVSVKPLPGDPEGLRCSMEYATDLFDQATVQAMLGRLLRVLDQVCADPAIRLAEICVLTEDERAMLSAGWESNCAAAPTASVPQLFDQQVEATPDALALIFQDQTVSYRQLGELVEQLARRLVSDGIRRGDVIGICLPRGVEMAIAVLAVLRCGATLTMLDPDFPDARLASVLERAAARLVLVTGEPRRFADSVAVLDLDQPAVWAADEPPGWDAIVATPQDAACVIFTSGSTGQAKAILTTQGALVGTLTGQRYAEFGPGQVWLQCAPVSWDAFLTQLLGPLLAGGTTVLQAGQRPEPAEIARLAQAHSVTVLDASASLFNHLWDEYPAIFSGMRWALTGGEPASASHVAGVLAAAPGIRVVNGYGPVESMGFSTSFEASAGAVGERVPIGSAVAAKSTYVLDADLRLLPPGSVGELYLTGAGLALGYLGQPGLTAARFVADPFGSPGERMYRTGDLVRRQPAGRGLLEFVGRTDEQVKIRGFRVEPGEIEAALTRQPDVAQAAVTVQDDSAVGKRLIAYAVPAAGRQVSAAALRAHCADQLPEYLVPSAFVVMDAFPLTVNGKLDRKALPEPDLAGGSVGRGARGARQEILCGIVAELLGRQSVGADDDFFALGGHSLLAARLVGRVRATFGIELAMRTVFEHPTVAGLDAQLDGLATARPALRTEPLPDRLPLSFAQQRLWLLDTLQGPSSAYNVPAAFELAGTLDLDALRLALHDLTTRHQGLRTVIGELDGQPHQCILPAEQARPELSTVDCGRAELPALLDQAAQRTFKLTSDLPIRVWLFSHGPTEHVLLLVLHHIATDGWSVRPLLTDLSRAYTARCAGAAPDWAPLPVQYADYTLWQQRNLLESRAGGSTLDRGLRYWRHALAGVPDEVTLRPDRPRTAAANLTGHRVPMSVAPGTHQALLRLARQSQSTLFMVLQAAFVALLSRLGAGEDIVLGTPVAGRDDEALDDLIGFFVNTLALRTDASGNPTFRQLLDRVRESDLGAYAHQQIPFERIVEELNPDRSTSRHPLFQVMFVLQNMSAEATADLGGIPLVSRPVGAGAAKFDLGLGLVERTGEDGAPDGLSGEVEYATELYDNDTITALARRYVRLLDAVAAEPDSTLADLELLGEDERARLTPHWSGKPATDSQAVCVHRLFEAQAARRPDAIALAFRDQTRSYGELDRDANRLGHRLLASGVQAGDVIGICVPRGIDMVVALLAVLKAGAAYAMLDPQYPAARIADLAGRTGARMVIATEQTGSEIRAVIERPLLDIDEQRALIAREPDTVLPVPAGPDWAACVMFTSGSTGTPKGVLTSHRAVVASVLSTPYLDLGEDDVSVQQAAVSWDIMLVELFGPLLAGARSVLLPGSKPEPAEMFRLIRQHHITTVSLSAGQLNVLTDEYPGIFAGLRRLMVGGDVVSPRHLGSLLEQHPSLQLINGYGPLETTVLSHCHQVGAVDVASGSIPIGAAVAGKSGYVLDSHLQPVPAGTPGELYLTGIGLAMGYLGEPALSSARFVADPFGAPGERMYRTGDVVLRRRGSVEVLEFLGRADDQVKIRGFRVEPGEVDAVLGRNPELAQSAVIVREDAGLGKYLVAYLVPRAGRQLELEALRADCARQLPDYMVPARFVVLDALPLTANGKLNRRALPEPAAQVRPAGRQARGARQQILCGIFAELLGQPVITVDDDFFALGGHSLLAVRLMSRIRSALGIELTMRAVFDAPTVAQLDRLLDGTIGCRPSLVAQGRPEPLPLTFAQRRLWLADTLNGRNPAYNVPSAFEVSGALQVPALERALADVLARHEPLRTRFGLHEDEPCQLIVPAAEAIVELNVLSCQPHELPPLLEQAARHQFDLTTELPVRAWLFALEPQQHVLLLVMHHIAVDGRSIHVLMADLSTAYQDRCAGLAPGWAPLRIQYADYGLWQRTLLGSEGDPASIAATELEFWRETLAGVPAECTLPTDRSRPASPDSLGGIVNVEVGADTHRALLELARGSQATLFMALQAGLVALLNRLGAGEDIVLGTPVAGRDDEALDDIVGFFVNTLALRTDTSGEPSFRELLGRIRSNDLAAYAHQHTPFERVVEELQPVRSLSRHPLFQVMFVLQAAAAGSSAGESLGDLALRPLPVGTGAAKFDLTVGISETVDEQGRPAGLFGELEYATQLYDQASITALGSRYRQLLEAVVAEPDAPVASLDLLTSDERRQLTDWNSTGSCSQPQACVHELIETQAKRRPDVSALIYQQRHTTYAELNSAANRLARWLRAVGVRTGDVVGICIPRSTDMVISLLAVLKVGATYAQLDPDYPADRIADLIRRSAAVATIVADTTDPRLAAALPGSILRPDLHADTIAGLAEHDLGRTAGSEDGACIMFTSGSTGAPKGVLTPHRALVSTLIDQNFIDFDEDEIWLQNSPVSWDVFAIELLGPLLSGATCVLQPGQIPDPSAIVTLVDRHRISTMHASASLLNYLVDEHDAAFTGIRQLITGGEAASVEHVRRLLEHHPGIRLVNAYSPLENTIFALCHQVSLADTERRAIPVGRCMRGKRIFVLDERLQLLPPGTPGELYMAGAGLAHGYLRQPDLTGERFVANPYGAPGERMYRTGDLVRLDSDGLVHFLGRVDGQVKIRGFRVEPDEVAAVLAGHPAVGQAAVLVRDDLPGGGRRLVGYAVPNSARQLSAAELRDYLAGKLAEYMVPSAFVVLPEFPRTPNGKLDRKALPKPSTTSADGSQHPQTPRQELLCEMFSAALGVNSVGVDDGFFDLGGHSLLASKLIAEINATFGIPIAMRELFQAPTVRSLDSRLQREFENEEREISASMSSLLALRKEGDQPPLFCIHPGSGIGWAYFALLPHLAADLPVYAIQAPGLLDAAATPGSVEQLADSYLDLLRQVQPNGPYRLVGWSFGAVLAHAMAVSLERLGEQVQFLALLDGYPASSLDQAITRADDPAVLAALLNSLGYRCEEGDCADLDDFERRISHTDGPLGSLDPAVLRALPAVFSTHADLLRRHRPATYHGDVEFFRAAADKPAGRFTAEDWRPYVAGTIFPHTISCSHDEIASGEPIAHIGRVITARLRARAQRAATASRSPHRPQFSPSPSHPEGVRS